MASFQSQYGIRLSRDLHGMKWTEFRAYIAGLGNDTPLGKIISIRAEDDPKVLQQFNASQKKIRSQWRTRRARQMPQKDLNSFLADMEKAFAGLAGGAHEKDQVH